MVQNKMAHVFPIIGDRKVEQLQRNLEALDITLSDEQVKFLESQAEFDIGFPMSMIGDGSDVFIGLKVAGTFQKIPYPAKALGPPEL
ncbi:putative aryl-alcohol dehydrogenase [Moniliophthora roreri MCA 2997]|uniref:Aryl-alcohol dehydrogenase n=2 Tax=Moniliophthora roreri TaxID=221103 RepID=V2XFU6_MONRO|nr:putative aryl-alcohol dehydrogenase [Moniliophthora roreri MCA 2997]